jgi:hypothetical protein
MGQRFLEKSFKEQKRTETATELFLSRSVKALFLDVFPSNGRPQICQE